MTEEDAHLGDATSALLDGELDEAAAARARAHLASCASCASELAREAAARDALRGLPAPAAPPGYAAGIVARRRRLVRVGASAATTSAVLLGLLVVAAAPAPTPTTEIHPRVEAMTQLHLGQQVGTPVMARSIAAPSPTAAPGAGAEELRGAGGIVSVFEEAGDLDDSTIAAGRPVRVGDRWAVVTERRPAVVVVDAGDSVLTVVARDLTAAIAVLEQLIASDGRSLAERARDACEGLVGSFSLTG
jgi:anti-sigma factor RsiW